MITPFDAVVLSGGGVKVLAQLGVLHYLHRNDLLRCVLEYAGTSAGSVVCLLLHCGFTPMEIFQKLYVIDNFLHPEGQKMEHVWLFFKDKGLFSLETLFDVAENMIVEKLKCSPTFAELHKITGKKLVITATNISKMRQEYFDHISNPKLKVIDACKMSCNLPIIFKSIIYKGDYYVDGGLGDNFPVECIEPNPDKNILGIMVCIDCSEKEDLTFMEYVHRIMTFPINIISTSKYDTFKDKYTILSISLKDVTVVDFSMERSKRMDIFMTGYREAKERFEKNISGWSFLLDEDIVN